MAVEAKRGSNLGGTTRLNPDQIFPSPRSSVLSELGMEIQKILILNGIVNAHNPASKDGMSVKRYAEVVWELKTTCGKRGIDPNSLKELGSQFRKLVEQREVFYKERIKIQL